MTRNQIIERSAGVDYSVINCCLQSKQHLRKDNMGLIEEVFKKTVTIARSAGILELGHLSTDGTKIKANASNNYTLSCEELKEIRNIIEKGIEIDEEEDKLYGDRRGDELPPEPEHAGADQEEDRRDRGIERSYHTTHRSPWIMIQG